MLFRDQNGETLEARWGIFRGLIVPDSPDGPLEKVCPNENCERRLPQTAGVYDSMMIGLVGARATGKSHYVAALVEELSSSVSARFNCALMALDGETQRRYDHEFYSRLYLNCQELPPTPPGAAPLLYELRRAPKTRGGRCTGVTLALYDQAGETFEDMDEIAASSPYLDRVSGLILFIDPLQIETVRQIVGSSVRLPPRDPQARPAKIIDNVVSVLRKHGQVTEGRQFSTPVAMTFTKADVLRDAGLIPDDAAWSDDSMIHDGSYDQELHKATSGIFGQLLLKWAPAAFQGIEVNFEDRAFFGVSATGCASDDQGVYPRIAPWRVEEPVLWLLSRLGVIPG
jgi:hypothetical protein